MDGGGKSQFEVLRVDAGGTELQELLGPDGLGTDLVPCITLPLSLSSRVV